MRFGGVKLSVKLLSELILFFHMISEKAGIFSKTLDISTVKALDVWDNDEVSIEEGLHLVQTALAPTDTEAVKSLDVYRCLKPTHLKKTYYIDYEPL